MFMYNSNENPSHASIKLKKLIAQLKEKCWDFGNDAISPMDIIKNKSKYKSECALLMNEGC